MNKAFLTLLAALASHFLIGQSKYQNVGYYGLPDALNHPTKIHAQKNHASLDYTKRTSDPKRPWKILVDRSGVTTSTGKALTIGEEYYIADEELDKVWLVKDVDEVSRLNINSSATDYGWVLKNQVLLWYQAIIDPSSKIDIKALLVNTAGNVKNASEKVAIYDRPSNSGRKISDRSLLSFYFVYKYEGDYVLLGRNYQLGDENQVGRMKIEELVGWVHKDRIFEWNHRVCLEPNFKKSSVSERMASGKSAKVFSTISAADSYRNGILESQSILWDNDPIKVDNKSLIQNDRYLGSWVRMPIMSHRSVGSEKDNYRFRVGVNADLGEAALNVKIKIDEINKEYAKISENVNIVFVIDGTKSMSQYYPSIAKAIGNSMEYLATYESKKVMFGAVVYRDVAEGDRSVEIKRTTTNHQSVTGWIKAIKVGDKVDKDKHEGLYYGIHTALKKAGFRENQTNIMIVVGDAGDFSAVPERMSKDCPGSKECISKEELLDEMYKMDVHFVSVLVNNQGAKWQMDYEKQMKFLLTENNNRAMKKAKKRAGGIELKPLIASNNSGEFYYKNSPNLGKYYYPVSKSISPSNLTTHLNNVIKESNEFVESIKAELQDLSDGKGLNEGTGFSNGVWEILNLTETEKRAVLGSHNQLMLSGYTPRKINGLKEPIFEYVLLVTQSDLDLTIAMLEKLERVKDVSGSTKRKELEEAWLTIVEIYAGEISAARVKAMTSSEIVNMLQGGFPINNETALSKYMLADLVDATKVPADEIDEYLEDITDKKGHLVDIRDNGKNDPWAYLRDNSTYYWIPAEYLP